MEWRRPPLSHKYKSPLLHSLTQRRALIKDMFTKWNFSAAQRLIRHGRTNPSANGTSKLDLQAVLLETWGLIAVGQSVPGYDATRKGPIRTESYFRDEHIDIHCNVKCGYRHNPSYNRARSFPRNNPSHCSLRDTFSNAAIKKQFHRLWVSGCFNCRTNHLLKDFTLPHNTSKAAARKLNIMLKILQRYPL